jgi:hypothetical protein
MNEMLHDITPNEMSLDVCVSPKKKKMQTRIKDHFRKCVQWRCLDLSVACHVIEYSMVSKTIMLVLII